MSDKEKKLRVAIVGESPSMPTGFGMQVKMVAGGLARLGWDVVILAQSVPMPVENIPGVSEVRCANIHNLTWLDDSLNVLQPDVVLCFNCTGSVAALSNLKSAPANCPVFFWFPYEGAVVPNSGRTLFRGLAGGCVIHLTEHARRIWSGGDSPVFESDVVIPHAVDPSLYSAPLDRDVLRRKWARRLGMPLFEDTFVVFNLDRNIWHKRWDATFDFVRRLSDKLVANGVERDVLLVAHTKKIQTMAAGHPAGYSLPAMEDVYGLNGRVFYTDFDFDRGLSRSEIAELLRMADMRLTTSSGEGFGVPTIEAAAAGVPQLVNRFACAAELLPSGSPFLVEPSMVEAREDSLWAVPDVSAMVDRAFSLFFDEGSAARLQHHLKAAREYVLANFSVDAVCRQFDNLFVHALGNGVASYAYDRRHGLYPGRMTKLYRETVQVVAKVAPGGSVFELGAFDGGLGAAFDEFCVGYHGLEWDTEAIRRIPVWTRRLMEMRSPEPPFPDATVAVVHNQTDRIYRLGGLDGLTKVYSELAKYRWLFLRNEVEYAWGTRVVGRGVVSDTLKRAGAVRRTDLEDAIRADIVKGFAFEIWEPGSAGGGVPEGVARSMRAGGERCRVSRR